MQDKNRKKIPIKISKLLQKEINSKCPFCNNEDVGHFQIHHIDGNPQNNQDINLMMLCPICHSKITKGDIEEEKVLNKKIELIKGYSENKIDTNARTTNIMNINSGVHKSILANQLYTNNINIKGKTKPKLNHPEGSIGANLTMRNYVKHLIDRYQDYMKNDLTKNKKTKYCIIYNAIKKEFGVDKYTFVQTNKFNDLISFIQLRIDKTIQGKINKSKGIKNYSTFQEYLDKHNLTL